MAYGIDIYIYSAAQVLHEQKPPKKYPSHVPNKAEPIHPEREIKISPESSHNISKRNAGQYNI